MADWVKILKDYVDTLETIVGTEGGVSLANKLTTARAALLDQITALRMAELDAGNIPTDLANIIAYVDLIDDVTNGLAAIKAEVEGLAGAAMRGTDGAALAASWTAGLATILANFTALRIGYLDNINNAQLLNISALILGRIDAAISSRLATASYTAERGTDGAALAASWTAALATALGNYTAARAGYLDNINQAGLLQVTAARAALLDQITALRLAELDAANIPTDLANIITYVDLIDDATNGLAAIKAEVEGLAGAAMRGTDNAALAASWTAALATALGNYTAARAAYLDNINQAGLLQLTAARAALLDQITAARLAELDAANIPADIDGLKTSRNRQLFSMDFWSVPLESVVLTDVAAPGTDVALPDVVVDLPAGVTVVQAIAMFKFRMLGNAGAANALQGDQHIGVQKGGAGGYADAISLDDNMFGIAAATREGGDVVIGDHNVVAKVDGDATYNLLWTASLVDVANLTFYDCQTGLKIWYSV